MVEVVAVGTAVRRGDERFKTATPQLITQAVIVDRSSERSESTFNAIQPMVAPMAVANYGARTAGNQAIGCLVSGVVMFIMLMISLIGVLAGNR